MLENMVFTEFPVVVFKVLFSKNQISLLFLAPPHPLEMPGEYICPYVCYPLSLRLRFSEEVDFTVPVIVAF